MKLRCAVSKYDQSKFVCSFCDLFRTDNNIWDSYLKIMIMQEGRSSGSVTIYRTWLE